MKAVFLRLLAAEDKAGALLGAVREPERGTGVQRFDVDLASFASVPRSPFAYWVGDRLRRLFEELPALETDGRTAKQGLATADDFRFLRTAWEVGGARGDGRWVGVSKGGVFSPVYSDIALVLEWSGSGAILKAKVVAEHGNAGKRIYNEDCYFRPGLTWPRRTQGGLSLRAMPAGCIFADKGPAVFVENDHVDTLLALLVTANSRVFKAMVDTQMAFGSYEVGVLQRTPVPRFSEGARTDLARLARRAWSQRRALDTRAEASQAFTLPALLQVVGADLGTLATAWSDHSRAVSAEIASVEAEIDDRCFVLYGVGHAERNAITSGFGLRDSGELSGETGPDLQDDDTDDEADDGSSADPSQLVAELVSWAVGVALGRFDVRLATRERPLPSGPEPFDRLPACSPGMLAGHDGLPLPRAPAGYPIAFPETGILVDEPGHPRDLGAAVRNVFDLVFGSRADTMWSEASSVLDPRAQDLRSWLATSFFEHHLQRYSKSRRKAPIYWPLSTPSGRYTVWLYAHRLTSDSLLLVQHDLLAPKLALEERKLGGLTGESAYDRTERGRQQDFVDELRAMRDELARVAPLFRPTLDDGIVLVCAPLWRLFRHKPWQKELRSKWDELVEGKYDWAQIAMHLWPERVVPKCADDRSLAIAHGLEDVFWVEDSAGKWQKRSTPTKPVAGLVAERTSAAVKAALKSLTEAPTPTTTTAKARRERKR